MDHPRWIWQQPDWPRFHWRAERLAPLLRECAQAQGRLLGMVGATGSELAAQSELDVLLQNILTSSAIEGEQLNVGSVRSSLARRLGLEQSADGRVSPRSEGLAELMLDATQHFERPLDEQRLLHWHALLFPEQDELLPRRIHVGALRGEEPMQVVSGRLDSPTVHFEAPPRDGLERQLNDFLDWFASSRSDASLDPLLRAGIAHFWFVTLHPFDDGNGRLTRAITDLALAQAENQAIRFYAMSASILDDRSGYYRILESSQKGDLDISAWLEWFLGTLLRSLQQALARIDRVLAKSRFWQQHREQALSVEQIRVLNRLLDGGERGFEDGISASQYQAVAKVSKATATRHLSDLLEKGCLRRLPGGGRSTRYQINWTESATPSP
ncbi:Fic family protein [Pseudomonas schmalbachii]|uniref:Fic family protein n=1 Tax=Pseudomonas schmalbachii TaxID=2816993 RepID=A0ABS3TX56_9PSED|nr:Fic family protein [Pseudomonas schmalbachii]MBO3278242.1 Fic family protein [Pseudomonas schmalbachii]